MQKPLWIKSTKKKRLRQKKLWIKLNKNDFDSLTEDVYNYDNDEFKTTVDKKLMIWKIKIFFFVKTATQKISKNKTLKLYSDLIAPDISAFEEWKGKAKGKRKNILNVLKNWELVFTGLYLHHDNVPKPKSRESIAERTKLRR